MTREEPLELRELPVFAGLSEVDMKRLLPMMQRAWMSEEMRLLHRGARSEAVYFLVKGGVKVCAVERDDSVVMLAMLGPGEVLGEVAAVDGRGHSADVITMERSLFWWMTSADFCCCLDTMPRFARNLAGLMARRLRGATTHLHSLATQDVGARVARQLVTLAHRYVEPGHEGDIRIPLRLTQTDLGELVGASRVRVNEVVVGFKKRGFLSVDSSCHATIHNLPALVRRCGESCEDNTSKSAPEARCFDAKIVLRPAPSAPASRPLS